MNTVITVILPLVVLTAVTFLIFRLRFFADRIDGRYAFLFGGLLTFFAAVWQLVKIHPAYDNWFIITAYPVIDFVQYGVLLIGLLLVGIGLSLYSDFWQTRLEDMKIREGKLSILDNLQNDARQPYQLMELLNISLKEIIFNLQGCAGAIFLINRRRRQFVLTSATGLTREETAHLEYYPLQGNIVSQAVELGDPLLTGEFDFVSRQGEPVKSRFKSGMVLPLISGIEKVGGILLFAEETKYFSNADIKFLTPVADWLSEKIKTARLSRELSVSKNEIEKLAAQQTDFIARMRTVSNSFGSPDSITTFCRSLIGLTDSESVHLVGIRNGVLSFYGGSEPLLDLSENYRTALINAVGRKKPLIINQESSDESGRARTVLSNLVCPLDDGDSQDALLFRREASAFKVDDYGIKIIGVFSRLARMILNRNSIDRLAITRRLGLDKILELLKFDEDGGDFEKEAGFFVRQIADILPPESQAVTFVKDDRGAFKAVDGLKVKPDDLKNFYIQSGEGGVGRAVVESSGLFLYGKARVGQNLDAYDVVNRNGFNKIAGDKGLPVFVAHCPIQRIDSVIGVAVIMIYDMDESEKGEWERLLTLAAGLYSLRLTMLGLQQYQLRQELSDYESGQLGLLVNRLNNHLSAVVGNAELLSRREDVTGNIKQQLRGIMSEAEKAASLVKKSLAEIPQQPAEIAAPPRDVERLNDIVENTLIKFHISGNLYMTGGQPREINMNFNEVGEIPFSRAQIEELFEKIIDHFTRLATGEDIISINIYQMDEYIYLDLSRHRKNFPPVDRVAKFGEYIVTGEASQRFPANDYLKIIKDKPGFFALDKDSSIPAYLSFKFPLKDRTVTEEPSPTPGKGLLKVLAIDDEEVILDLISAMCQSMGYRVKTALSGQAGINLALKEKFDIVLTDLAMPDISGYEVARRIRKVYTEIPIILVTGWEAKLDSGRLEPSGITRVLYKPFRIEQLMEIIEKTALNKI